MINIIMVTKIMIMIIMTIIVIVIIMIIIVGGFQRWFNLTLVNISADDADDYTCVGVNIITIIIIIINNKKPSQISHIQIRICGHR